jgi:hypothetical protein
MAGRDLTQREVLFSDLPGDREKVRAILAGWGVGESAIRRLMREQGDNQRDTADAAGAVTPRSPAPPARFAGSK